MKDRNDYRFHQRIKFRIDIYNTGKTVERAASRKMRFEMKKF
jgi:hypothetical protein